MDYLREILEYLTADWPDAKFFGTFFTMLGICFLVYIKYAVRARHSDNVAGMRFVYTIFYAIICMAVILLGSSQVQFMLKNFPAPVIPSFFVITICLASIICLLRVFYRFMLFRSGGRNVMLVYLLLFPAFMIALPLAGIILCMIAEGSRNDFLSYEKQKELLDIFLVSAFLAYHWLVRFAVSPVENSLWDDVEKYYTNLGKNKPLSEDYKVCFAPKNNNYIQKQTKNYILKETHDYIVKQNHDYTRPGK